MALTQEQIENTIVRAKCCLADMSFKLAKARAQGNKDDCLEKKVILLTMYIEALQNVLECPDPDNPPLVSPAQCNLLGISGGLCWDGIGEILYILNADGANVLPYQDYWFEYAFSDDQAGPWTVANGYNDWYAAIPLAGVTFNWIRITMKCNEFDVNSEEVIFMFKADPSEYSATTFGYYSTPTSALSVLEDTIYIQEGSDLTISNLNPEFIISSIENLTQSIVWGTNIQTLTIASDGAGYPADGDQIEILFEYIGTEATLPCAMYRRFYVQIVPNPVITPSALLFCTGGSVDLEVLNHVYDSYLWSNGDTTPTTTITAGGTYSVLVGEGSVTGLIDYQFITENTDTILPIITDQSTGLEMGLIEYIPFGTIITLEIVDNGSYTSGYPLGTTYEWVGIITGPSTLPSDNGSIYQALVTLPNTCSGISAEYHLYTVAIQTDAVIVDEQCDGGLGSITVTVNSDPLPESAHTLISVTYDWYDNAMALITSVTTASLTDTLPNLPSDNYFLEVTGTYSNGFTTISGTIPYTVSGVTGPSALNVSVTQPECPTNDFNAPARTLGIALLTAVGGTAPYTYYVDGVPYGIPAMGAINVIDIEPGTYTTSVTDANGCSVAGADIVITAISDWSVTAAEIACDSGIGDGQFEVTAITGGTGPYFSVVEVYDSSLALVDTFDPTTLPYTSPALPADTYQLYMLDANGCSYAPFIEITTC